MPPTATVPPSRGGGPQASEEPVLLHLLTARAERRDTRVFAHATAETQVSITDTYGSRPVSRAANVVINTQEPGFLEVFPRVASRPPRLLQELESMLVDRLRAADKAVCTSMLLPRERDSRMAANLSLDAHRQVFAAFVQGFSTYTNLLSRIQAEFECALNEGVRCASENVEMRKRMAAEAEKQATHERDVRCKILAEEVQYRKAAYTRLQEVKERTQRLAKRAAAAEKELNEVRAEEERLLRQVASRRATAEALQQTTKREQVWSTLGIASTVQDIQVGPITDEDQAFLDAEYTSQVPTRGGPEGLEALKAAALASAPSGVALSVGDQLETQNSLASEMLSGSLLPSPSLASAGGTAGGPGS